jgi:hypothetical protein
MQFSLRVFGLCLAAGAAVVALDSSAAAQPSIREYTRGFDKRDGYLPLYWDAGRGRLLLEIPNLNEDLLYLTSLATGTGAVILPEWVFENSEIVVQIG